MSCNCKKPIDDKTNLPNEKNTLSGNIVKYFLKTIAFLISILLLPVFNLVLIWFLFQTLVLNKNVDLRVLSKKFIKLNDFLVTENEIDKDNK
jgi:hypothetical protein